ncbi:hypothetical protein RND71_012836 [Anisodus tanguticus]|uniref:Uncharacterized protein n=1 Tax=Anisodus tanguticus TaxID=243964 RepID=A0AAE1SE36_9SOLA|nr:hypothetical protein RND71_012836 [Anisodus tanguticus]
MKSLLRFKCVSKSWRCWISSPNFQRRKQGREGSITMMYTRRSTSRRSSRRPSFSFIDKQLTSENLSCPLRKRRAKTAVKHLNWHIVRDSNVFLHVCSDQRRTQTMRQR